MGNRTGGEDRTKPQGGLDSALGEIAQQLQQALAVRPLGRLEVPGGPQPAAEVARTANGLLDALERAEGRAQSAARDRAELDDSLAELEARLADEVLARERMARELERQRAILRQTVDSLPYCMFWRDRNGVYLGANHNKLRALGLASMDQLVGKSTYDMCLTREEADFYLQVDRQVMESGQPIFNLEEVQQRPDGPHTLLISKVPLRDDSGAIIGVMGMYIDVTERAVTSIPAAARLERRAP